MSLDTVDDLHHAEDIAAAHDPDYCRPTCIENAEDDGGCLDEAECGCPCHFRDDGCPQCGQTGYLDDQP